MLFDNTISNIIADEEAAKYRFLAELKKVKKKFAEKRLYPDLGDLASFLADLNKVAENKEKILSVPKKPEHETMFSILQHSLRKESVDRESLRKNVESVHSFIEWAIPEVESVVDKGMEVHDTIESKIEIMWIGVVPRYIRQGLLLIPSPVDNDPKRMLAFSYSLLLAKDKSCFQVQTKERKVVSTYNPFEAKTIFEKQRSVKDKFSSFVLATAFIDVPIWAPFEESVLPISRRSFFKFASADQALNSAYYAYAGVLK